MAGFPERLTSQSLTTEAKKRIGAYYLSRLLEKPTKEHFKHSFDAINSKIYGSLNIGIPPALIDQFELASQDWTELHNSLVLLPLPALYIGKPRKDSPLITTNTAEAIATIEIANRIDFNREIEDTVPSFLRIAGVAKDDRNPENSKIIAATFDLTDSNRLAELNVSVSNDEYGDIAKDLPVIYINKTTASIPTNKDNPYATAGLITEAMCRKVNQYNLLILRFNNGNSIVEPLGYYIERGNGLVTVGLRDDAAKRRSLTPWRISVPAALSKA